MLRTGKEHLETLRDGRVVYVGSPEEAVEMAKAGADAIIAHVGTTVGGSIGVTKAVVPWEFTLKRTQEIIDAASRVRKDIFFLAHGGPINTPEDADRYQTVFAREPGSIAAPTAGLHLTGALLSRLRERGVGIARVGQLQQLQPFFGLALAGFTGRN